VFSLSQLCFFISFVLNIILLITYPSTIPICNEPYLQQNSVYRQDPTKTLCSSPDPGDCFNKPLLQGYTYIYGPVMLNQNIRLDKYQGYVRISWINTSKPLQANNIYSDVNSVNIAFIGNDSGIYVGDNPAGLYTPGIISVGGRVNNTIVQGIYQVSATWMLRNPDPSVALAPIHYGCYIYNVSKCGFVMQNDEGDPGFFRMNNGQAYFNPVDPGVINANLKAGVIVGRPIVATKVTDGGNTLLCKRNPQKEPPSGANLYLEWYQNGTQCVISTGKLTSPVLQQTCFDISTVPWGLSENLGIDLTRGARAYAYVTLLLTEQRVAVAAFSDSACTQDLVATTYALGCNSDVLYWRDQITL